MNEKINKNEPNGSSSGAYFIRIMILMGVIHIIDVFVSNSMSLVQSSVAKYFFPELNLADAVARLTLITTISLFIMLFQFLIKTWADKYGRKPVLLLSILGMSIGNLISAFSTNVYIFAIGNAISIYFLVADIQLLFIAEESAPEKRGFWIFFTLMVGNFGTLLLPFIRGIFITEFRNDWQFLFLIPSILGFILFILMFFFLQESKIYLAAKNAGELNIKSGEKFSFLNAIRDLRKSIVWDEYKWRLVGSILFVLGMAAFFSYTEPLLEDNNFTEIEKNTTMYIRIIFSLIWFLITGKLSDVMGRKITLILDKLLFLSGEILLLISVFNHWIFLTGISWGMVFAGCWGFMNLNITATNEIIPTKLRSSAVGLSSLISYGFSVSAFLILPFILESTENFALLYVICMPFTIALILVISFKYKETVGVDMEKIKE